jgi:uncharacterized protein (DUF486 family)
MLESMRRAWPSAITVIGGIAFIVIALAKGQTPENRLYSCDEDFDCRAIAVLDGPLTWPWYLAGAVCLIAAGVMFLGRRS